MAGARALAPWRAGVLVGVLALGPMVAASASAQQIRVLLVMPNGPGRLARQVAQLNDALSKSSGRVVAAPSLLEADAVVQFTRFRQVVGDKGEPQSWWDGQYKLLKPTTRDDPRAPAVSERFRLLVIGREDWEVEPALELLGHTLARALGRESAKTEREAI